MKSNGKGVKILPRVLFEGWSVNDYMTLFADERMTQEVAEFITQSIDVSDFSLQIHINVHSVHDCIFVIAEKLQFFELNLKSFHELQHYHYYIAVH